MEGSASGIYDNFTMYGTVTDRKHGGRPPKVSKEVALHANNIFKAGTVVKAYPHADAKHEVDVHIWWTSIEVACQQCQALQDLCTMYNITCKQLLKYMKEADPNLVRRRIDIKLDLTKEQKAKRKSAAEKLWQMFQREPDMLSRVYFIDECKIWMSTLAAKSVKVYCDAHDEDVRAVLPCKWYRNLKPCPDVKLAFVAAVNPVHGAVFLRFTTGTTDNKDAAGNLNAPYYLKKEPTKKAKGMTQMEFIDCMRDIAVLANQQQAARGTTPLYCFDNPNVHIGPDALQALADIGISEDQLLRIAPYSPDFNRPIEHAFGTLKATFRNYLYTHGLLSGAGVEPRKLQEILCECFMKITAASVMADAVKLPDLWDVVRSVLNRVFVCRDNKQRKGTAGDWPRKDQR